MLSSCWVSNVCVCVREREREKERVSERTREGYELGTPKAFSIPDFGSDFAAAIKNDSQH